LAIGGRMIIEVSHSSKVQEFILIEKDNKGALKRTNLIPVQFTPLIRGNNEK
jgi:protein-L-isoaspartate O-methyltransferase